MGATGDSIHILHVDDEPDFAEMAAEFLEREDERFTVETATNASEGLGILAGHEIDCVVSDYDMPGQTGIEFLEAVREEHPDLPFILYTGKGSEEVASDAISAGATDYLQKGTGTDQYELLANRIRNGVEQFRDKQRRATLERIRALVSDITHALVQASSQGQIERQVCELLADSDPYQFAVIVDVSPETKAIQPRTWAGTGEAFLDEFEMSVAEGTPGRHAPGGRAYHEREIAVAQHIRTDPDYEPWRELALEYSFEALAVVPLEYEKTLHGLLAVFADRPHAFDDTEREVLTELGNDIAFAFHAQARRDDAQDERAFVEQALNALDDVFYVIGPDGELRRWNEQASEVTGYTDEEIADMQATELFPEDQRGRIVEAIDETLTTGGAVVEAEVLTAGGERIPYEFTGSRLTDTDGELIGLIGIGRDITERKAREQAIEDLHSTARAFMEAETVEGIAEIAVDAVRDILGMPASGIHLYDGETEGLVPVAWTNRTQEIVGDPPTFTPGEGIAGMAFETGEPRIYDDLSTIPERYNPDTDVRSQIALPLGDHGVLLIGSPDPDAFDDTDVSLAQTLGAHTTTALTRLKREQTLHQTQEQYRTLAENFPNGAVLVFDTDLRYQGAYGEGFEMAGFDPSAFEGKHISEVFDGETLETKRAMYEATLDGESRQREMRFAGRDYRVHTLPVEDDRGEPWAGIVITQDITEYKQRERELRDRERELRRQNERLDEFASVVSHDLQNPLDVAEGRLQLAMETDDPEHLDAVARAHERMRVLIEDLLALAVEGEDATEIEPVELAEIVEGCWRNVETAEATLVTDTDREIRADGSRFRQLLENLMRNAIEHGGPNVTVTVGNLPDGFYVADDGSGIPKAERGQVFDAGYSTSQEGTGFGLSIVQEVVEAHGWEIGVTDSETGGARFEITGVEIVAE